MAFYGQPGGYGGMDPMGGGYIASSPGLEGANGVASGKGGGGGGRNREKQSHIPVTIRQVLETNANGTEDKPVIDGQEIHLVSLVGCIVKIEEKSTKAVYMIEDGTGRINVDVFVDAEESPLKSQRREACTEHTYVHVVGKVNTFNNKHTIQSIGMRPISDMNEITLHFLEAIYSHLFHTKGPLHPYNGGVGGKMEQGVGITGSKQFNDGGFDRGYGAANYGGGAGGTGYTDGDLTPAQQRVLDVFNQDSSDQGLTVVQVQQALGGQIAPLEVGQAVELLNNDGHLYTTTDEYHFKSTGAN